MVKQIVSANEAKIKAVLKKDGIKYLNVSEFYCDTIQGEGINIGVPAAFLRLKNCTLNCIYCDTAEVWRYGSPYTFDELFEAMEKVDLPGRLRNGHHLVLTGGSPLRQQERVLDFVVEFNMRYGFKPFIEIENERVLMPTILFTNAIDCWNNSPKLAGSRMPYNSRYNPELLTYMSSLSNSWFKFVVSSEFDWNEIRDLFLKTNLIKKEQIILMPEGMTRKELEKTRPIAIEMATENGVRFTDRLHITLWDKMVGV
jgi:7-carboxy-7-deazaguanine synthase